MIERRVPETSMEYLKKNWVVIASLVTVVSTASVTVKEVTELKEDGASREVRLDAMETAIEPIKDSIKEQKTINQKMRDDVQDVKETVGILEERSRNTDRDVQEIKSYLKQILRKVQ